MEVVVSQDGRWCGTKNPHERIEQPLKTFPSFIAKQRTGSTKAQTVVSDTYVKEWKKKKKTDQKLIW